MSTLDNKKAIKILLFFVLLNNLMAYFASYNVIFILNKVTTLSGTLQPDFYWITYIPVAIKIFVGLISNATTLLIALFAFKKISEESKASWYYAFLSVIIINLVNLLTFRNLSTNQSIIPPHIATYLSDAIVGYPLSLISILLLLLSYRKFNKPNKNSLTLRYASTVSAIVLLPAVILTMFALYKSNNPDFERSKIERQIGYSIKVPSYLPPNFKQDTKYSITDNLDWLSEDKIVKSTYTDFSVFDSEDKPTKVLVLFQKKMDSAFDYQAFLTELQRENEHKINTVHPEKIGPSIHYIDVSLEKNPNLYALTTFSDNKLYVIRSIGIPLEEALSFIESLY